jgi:hypothetical protein
MMKKNKQLLLIVALLLIIAVFFAVMIFASSLQKNREKVTTISCPEKPLNITVWRCQGFFDQLENPMISYENGRWSLVDAETVNHPIRFTDKQGCRNITSRTIEYTPDINIDGQNISFDLLVSNLMGTDLAEVPYTVETRVGQRTASWDREYPGRDAFVARENGTFYNFSDGEIREIRVHAQLAVPPHNQSVKELVVVIPGLEAKAADGSIIRQDSTSEGDLMVVIQSPGTVLTDPTPVRTQRTLTDAPGAPTWVEEDRRIVQAFLENPNATVVYERNETDSTIGNYHIYQTDEGEIYVNDQSRRVDRAGFYESVPPPKKVVFSQDRAQAVAQSYAAKNYPGFSTRNMVLTEAKLLDHGDAGKEYSFAWQEQVLGIANGNFVSICISPENGEILSYLLRDRTAPEITEPKIAKEQAVGTAMKYFANASSLSTTEGLETSARASVVPFLQDRVMWIVDLHIDLPDDVLGQRCGEVYIDAETGDVALYNPCLS